MSVCLSLSLHLSLPCKHTARRWLSAKQEECLITSSDTESAGMLILTCQPPEWREINVCYLSHSIVYICYGCLSGQSHRLRDTKRSWYSFPYLYTCRSNDKKSYCLRVKDNFLVWIMLLFGFVYKSFYKHTFSFLFGRYPAIELVNHIVSYVKSFIKLPNSLSKYSCQQSMRVPVSSHPCQLLL